MTDQQTTSTLSIQDRELLILAAIEAKAFAYSPYFKFPVGASLLLGDGSIVKGTNVENVVYDGICAERAAIFKAISEGKRSFTAIAVVTNVPRPISPCGACRQMLRELCKLDMPVLLVPGDYPQSSSGSASSGDTAADQVPAGIGKLGAGGVRETTLGELLPDSFGPEDLPHV